MVLTGVSDLRITKIDVAVAISFVGSSVFGDDDKGDDARESHVLNAVRNVLNRNQTRIEVRIGVGDVALGVYTVLRDCEKQGLFVN